MKMLIRISHGMMKLVDFTRLDNKCFLVSVMSDSVFQLALFQFSFFLEKRKK